MADTTGYVTFTNVGLNGPGGVGYFSHTTLFIDYTTGAVTIPAGPPDTLTFTTAGLVTYTFNAADLHVVQIPPGSGNYVLHAGSFAGSGGFPALAVDWSGTSPTSFSGAAFQSAAGSGNLWSGVPNPNTASPTVCFAAGTVIRTPAGDVAVETLRSGDLVVTASGEMRPVKWVGHSDVDFRRTPDASPGQPIRIAADAFGPARPSHDLYLSAGHSVCVDLLGEVFIPVGHLVNGGTIAPVEVETISYWHVELDSHDVLLANNMPAESYLAMTNRLAFEEMRGLLPADLDEFKRTHADFCRPVVTEGPVLGFVRQRLAARAEEIGWTRSLDADLHLVADGAILRPRIESGVATFAFPARTKDLRLLSSTFLPAMVGTGSNDPRTLGVMLCDLAIGGKPVSLDDKRLCEGVHQFELHAGEQRRWTDGALVLDPTFWEGETGAVSLVVSYDVSTLRGWVPPATARKPTPVARPKLRAVG